MARILVLVLVFIGIVESVHAQVIQLPTFQTFSISTSVLVPDRGSAYLGGVNRYRSQDSRTGVPGLSNIPGAGRLFSNRGFASSASSSHAFATATIIDNSELDAAVLAEAAGRRGYSLNSDGVERLATFLSQNIARTNGHRPVARPSAPEPIRGGHESIGDVALTLAPLPSPQETRAELVLELAEAALAAGQIQGARRAFERAAELSTGEVRTAALGKLRTLNRE